MARSNEFDKWNCHFYFLFHSSLLLNVVHCTTTGLCIWGCFDTQYNPKRHSYNWSNEYIYIMLSYCGFLLSSFAHFICNCNTNSRVVLYVYRQSLGTPNKTNSYRMCAHVCACLRVIVFVCVCISQERERVRALRHMLLL